MSNRLRHYRRSMLRLSAEAQGAKLFRRGSGRMVMDEPSRLSTALHKARGTNPTPKLKPKRGTDAKRPTAAVAATAAKKPGLSDMLKAAIRRRMAQ